MLLYHFLLVIYCTYCLNAVNGKQPVRASRPTPPLGKHPGANFAKTYVDSSLPWSLKSSDWKRKTSSRDLALS